MDQPSKPSFADDPHFLASLPDLDAGLEEEDAPNQSGSRRIQPPAASPPAFPSSEPPSSDRLASVSPATTAFRPDADPPDLVPDRGLPDEVPPPPSARRALLDLFPPPPSGAGAAPSLPLGIAPPPKIAIRGIVPPAQPAAAASEPPVTYGTFYGLTEKPFSLSTDPKFLYHSTAHDQAAQELLSAIRRRDGLVVLTGETGIGKTMLCRAVTEELDRRTLTSIVNDPFISLEQLLQTVLVDFGVISRDDVARGRLAQTSSAELVSKLREFVASLVQLQAFAVIIIDEAQNLPIPVLEQLRALMDSDVQQRLLQLVLVGPPSLLKLLTRRELKRLRQRIAVRSELRPLGEDEIVGYVMHRLAVAGPQARVELDDPAFARLYHITGGVPRLVNLICDRALTLGHAASASVIDESLIGTAASDLDILPPEPRQRQLLRTAIAVMILVALMGVGAGAAAWVFRAPLERTIDRWEAIPPPPRPPMPDLSSPLPPVPPPATAASRRTAPANLPERFAHDLIGGAPR
ncbi:MAG: AAA family ATPase [Acidobacteria bacterium]|nr:AAA family ATPase [Acidobacteriota bacterium]